MAVLILLANDFSGSLYEINAISGAATRVQGTGLANLVGIARSATNVLYGLTTFSDNRLYTINPTNGSTAAVGTTGLVAIAEGDIAFDPTSGILYGLKEVAPHLPNQLFTLDLVTGRATIIGTLPTAPNNFSDFSAMTFDPSTGQLFVLDTLNGLLVYVDKDTGAISQSIPLSTTLGVLAEMAFFDNNTAFVVDGGDRAGNQLYLLNLANGKMQTVGPTGVPGGLAGLIL